LNLTQSEIKELRKSFGIAIPIHNLNTVSSDQLMRLPGMTSTLADNIVNHRFTKGKFRSVQGLYQVFGMTEEKFQTLSPYLEVE
jgi:DNA uptake protein ComE-like DNA-binding protein